VGALWVNADDAGGGAEIGPTAHLKLTDQIAVWWGGAVAQDVFECPGHELAVQFCAFDILVEGDDDLRKLPLHLRKASLERLLARRPDGIFVNPFERGEIGPDLFRAACDMGLEGVVSKHRDRPYQGGRSKHWIKVKNRTHPAMNRVMENRT